MTTEPVVASARAPAAACTGCGYDLSGVPGPVCPECGVAIAAPVETVPAMRSRVMRGSVWTFGGYIVNQVLRFGCNLILAHLLAPQHFGLMSLVAAFLQGLTMFSDIGLGPSIIQNKRGDDPVFLRTAWTLQVLRGVVLWMAAAALALPLSAFYNAPELLYILPVSGLNILITSFNSTSLYTLNRKLMLGRMTLLNLGSYIISMSVTIAWAWIYPTVWALVAGSIVSCCIYTVGTFLLCRDGHRDGFGWDRECLRSLITFGGWIFLSTVLTFMVGQGDRLIFGRLIPIDMLGVYSMALMLATFASQAVLALGGQVVFPAYSERVRSGRPLQPVFHQARQPLTMLSAYVAAGVFAAGPILISLLYPATFAQAKWMVQPLAAAGLLQALECTNGSALLAMGHARWVAAGNAAKLVGMVALIPLGYAMYGFGGAVGGLVVSEALKYATSVVGVRRFGLNALGRDLLVLVGAAASGAAALWLDRELVAAGVPAVARLFIVSAAVTVAWTPALLGMLKLVRGLR